MKEIKCQHKERCTMYSWRCEYCKRNKNAVLEDCFEDRGYVPSCTHGYADCIHDPAYLIYCSEKGYHKKLSSIRLQQLKTKIEEGCNCGKNVPMYDDEDK